MSSLVASVCVLLHLACGNPAHAPAAVPAAVPDSAPAASAAPSAASAAAPVASRQAGAARGAHRRPRDNKPVHDSSSATAEREPLGRRRSPSCLTHACSLPAQPPWPTSPYRYSTGGASLNDALQDLSSATHVPIASDPLLAGRVEGRFEMPPQRFVDTLAAAYGLVWYYDGAVLHVEPAAAQTTLIVRLNYASPAALHALLAQTGIADPRFVARDDVPARGLITFRGPRAYIAMVGRAAQRLEQDARERVPTAVRVVPLHYGAAADRAALANGRLHVASGIASRAARALDPHGDARAEITEYEAPLPVIGADARTNAVLVRDRPERLDADARAIAALDAPQALVTIGILIADADARTLRALGLDVDEDVDEDVTANVTAAGTARVERGAAHALLAALRAAPDAHTLADSEMQGVDGVALAWEMRAPRPIEAAAHAAARASARAPASANADGSADAPGPIDRLDGALRIVPRVDTRGAPPRVTLAAEWRGATIDVARAALGPDDALVMVEPAGPSARTRALARVIVLAPRVTPAAIDNRR